MAYFGNEHELESEDLNAETSEESCFGFIKPDSACATCRIKQFLVLWLWLTESRLKI